MIKTTIMQVLLARGWYLRSLLLRSMLISTSIHSCWSADGDDCIVFQSRSAYACLRRHCHYGRMSERWPHDRISKLVESNRRQCDLPPYSSTFTFTNSTHSLLYRSLSTSIHSRQLYCSQYQPHVVLTLHRLLESRGPGSRPHQAGATKLLTVAILKYSPVSRTRHDCINI